MDRFYGGESKGARERKKYPYGSKNPKKGQTFLFAPCFFKENMKKKLKKNPADLTLRKKKQQDNTKSQLVEILESHERRIQKLELVYTTLLDPTIVDKEVKKFLKGFVK